MITGLVQHVKQNPDLTRLLGVYDFGDGVKAPAIFNENPAPLDAPNPVLCFDLEGDGGRFATRAQRGGILQIRAYLWFDKNTSDKDNRRVAFLLYDRMDRSNFELLEEGWKAYGCVCSLPGKIKDKDGFPGYLMTLNLRIVKE